MEEEREIGMRQKKILRITGILTALLCLLQIAVPIRGYAAGGQMVIAVSADTVEVGQTVTVTLWAASSGGARASSNMTFTYNSDTFSFVSCNAEGYTGGEGGQVNAGGTSVEVVLRAVNAGDCTLQVSGTGGVVNETQEPLDSLTAAGVTIQAVSSGGTGSTGGQSEDGGLASLSLSAGELSPAFSASTLKYTATVPYETEAVEVTAVPAREGASVTVSGNQSLAVGENTISVTVEAENESAAVYEIIVTRQEQGAQTAAEPGNDSQGEGPDSTGDSQEEELTLEDARHQIQRLNEEYRALDERYKAEKSFSRKVMAVMAFLIVVLLLVCINLLIARGRRGNRWEDSGEDGPEEPRGKKSGSGEEKSGFGTQKNGSGEEKSGSGEEKSGSGTQKPGFRSRLRDSFKEHREDDWLDGEDEEEPEEDWLAEWPETAPDAGRKLKKEHRGSAEPEPEADRNGRKKKDSSHPSGKKPEPDSKGEIEVIDLDDF